MSNPYRFMTSIFHSNNHFRPKRKIFINNNDIIKAKYINLENNKTHVYSEVEPGLYELNFEGVDTRYCVDIYHPINTKGQRIIVNNINDVIYKTVSNEYKLRLYEIRNNNIIDDSVNSFFDIITITGKTTYAEDPNIYSPIDIDSIIDAKLYSYNSDRSEEDYLYIFLRHEISSLPDGTRDLFILDAEQNKAYILKNVGHFQISGDDERIIEVKTLESDNYCVYFVENKLAKFIDNENSIICSHFKSVSYTDLIDKHHNENCIALSYDYKFRHEGFYIKINKSIAPGIESFKNFIRDKYLSNKPVEILYPLMARRYLPIILDKYYLKTYFNNTELVVPDGYDISFAYKSI